MIWPINAKIAGVVLLATLMLTTTAPAVSFAQTPQPTHLKVIATHSILGDLVHNVAGDAVELTTLVGPDGDTHTYEPVPADTIIVAERISCSRTGSVSRSG